MSDYGQMPSPSRRTGRSDRGSQRGGWIGMRAIPQHYVQQQYRHGGIGSFNSQAGQPCRQINHWMGAAHGETVGSQVQAGVIMAVRRIGQPPRQG